MFMRILMVILLLGGVFGGIFYWKQQSMQQMAAAQAGGPPPPVIAVTPAQQETWQPFLQVVGSLTAVAGIEVTSEVGGQISAIHFSSGEQVRQGDLLLELDDDTDQAQLRGLVAERTLARLKFERVAKLVREKSVSKSDYDEGRATLDNAEALVSAQQALIAKKSVRAPFDGRLGIRRVDLGEYLTPGAPIVPLEKLDPIFADFTLPERELARVAVGQTIDIRVQAYADETFAGRITAIDPGVNVGSRTFRVRGELENASNRLRPGMFADIRVNLPQEEHVITVPSTAISYAPYGDSVFVIEDKEGATVATRRQVEIGASRDGRVAVVSGLQVGEQVVSAGHNKLRSGQAVKVETPTAAVAAKAD